MKAFGINIAPKLRTMLMQSHTWLCICKFSCKKSTYQCPVSENNLPDASCTQHSPESATPSGFPVLTTFLKQHMLLYGLMHEVVHQIHSQWIRCRKTLVRPVSQLSQHRVPFSTRPSEAFCLLYCIPAVRQASWQGPGCVHQPLWKRKAATRPSTLMTFSWCCHLHLNHVLVFKHLIVRFL